MAEDIVKFLLPDGTEVSNDPRFMTARQVHQAAVDAQDNRGYVGYNQEELDAATRRGGSTEAPQSGQEGVGEAAVPEDKKANLTPGLRGVDVTPHDPTVLEGTVAAEKGLDPTTETSSEDELTDPNKVVAEVRERQAKQREETPTPGGNADDQIDEEPEPGTPVSELTVPQLKKEAKRLGVKVEKGMKLGDLRGAVEAKRDEALGAAQVETSQHPQG